MCPAPRVCPQITLRIDTKFLQHTSQKAYFIDKLASLSLHILGAPLRCADRPHPSTCSPCSRSFLRTPRGAPTVAGAQYTACAV